MAENLPDRAKDKSEILFYQTEDGSSRIQVRIEGGETVWLSQRLLADLYKIGVNTVNHHIKVGKWGQPPLMIENNMESLNISGVLLKNKGDRQFQF